MGRKISKMILLVDGNNKPIVPTAGLIPFAWNGKNYCFDASLLPKDTGGTGGGSSDVASGLPQPKFKTAHTYFSYGRSKNGDTVNHLQVYFSQDVSGLAALNPELWIYRYHKTKSKKGYRNPQPGQTAQTFTVKKGWVHTPDKNQDRHANKKFFHGNDRNNAAQGRGGLIQSEFYDSNVVTGIANNKAIPLLIDARHWFTFDQADDPETTKDFVPRFPKNARLRIALVVDDPTQPSGKAFSPLSDVFVARPQSVEQLNDDGNYVSYTIFAFHPDLTTWD